MEPSPRRHLALGLPAAATGGGAAVLLADAATRGQPDMAIVGVALVLSGVASVVLAVLLPERVVGRGSRADGAAQTPRAMFAKRV